MGEWSHYCKLMLMNNRYKLYFVIAIVLLNVESTAQNFFFGQKEAYKKIQNISYYTGLNSTAPILFIQFNPELEIVEIFDGFEYFSLRDSNIYSHYLGGLSAYKIIEYLSEPRIETKYFENNEQLCRDCLAISRKRRTNFYKNNETKYSVVYDSLNRLDYTIEFMNENSQVKYSYGYKKNNKRLKSVTRNIIAPETYEMTYQYNFRGFLSKVKINYLGQNRTYIMSYKYRNGLCEKIIYYQKDGRKNILLI